MLNHVTDICFICMCNRLFFGFFFVAIFISTPLEKISDYVPASNHSVKDTEIKEYRCFSFNFINIRETNLIIVKFFSLASKESDVR
jgi:hypothetical protein